MSILKTDTFKSFEELETCYQGNKDFQIITRPTNSQIAIVAPHGGKIEPGTSQIARDIAGDDFNLYIFEGIMPSANYQALHLTSSKFNEPECLELIANCNPVITIHGCKGVAEHIYLGGLDTKLKIRIYQTLAKNGFNVEVDHPKYLGKDVMNICNRGAQNAGLQIELSMGLRNSENNVLLSKLLRRVLANIASQ